MPHTVKRQPPQKLSAADWIRFAEQEFAKHGVDAVRVEPLAKKLNVTKGSFYWHFKTRRELLDSIIADWKRRSTSAVIERLSEGSLTPQERLKALFVLPFRRGQEVDVTNLEIAIRNCSLSDKAFAAVVADVDAVRLQYIAENFVALGNEADTAHLKALRFYCVMQGLPQITRKDNQIEIEGIFDSLL